MNFHEVSQETHSDVRQSCHFQFFFIILASPRMPLLASQSHEDQLEYVQEHDKITDSLEISGSNEVESGSTGKLNLKDKNAVETIYDIQCHL